MLSKLKLYGDLAEFCNGKNEFEAVINRPIDAIRFLRSNFIGLDKHILNKNYQVFIGDYNIDEDLLDFPSGGLDVKIIPVVAGAGNVGKIIAGVALIGFAMFTGGAGILGANVIAAEGAKGILLGSLNISALAGKLGMLLVLSGVAGLLTPTPELPDDESDPIKSFSFSGVQQTTRSGTAIPVVYGKTLVGSIPISTKIETNDIEA